MNKIGRWCLEHNLPAWVAFFAGWQLLSCWLPVPSARGVLTLVWRDVRSPGFLVTLGLSLIRMSIGYLGAALLGIFLGLLIWRIRWLDSLLGTLGAALNAMPGAAWVPLSVFLFGLNEKAVVFTIVLGATGVVMLNTGSGLKGVAPLILRAAQTLGARRSRMLRYVILPAAVPRIIDGLRLAWAFGWRALMAGELLITSVRGMGQLINEVARRRDIEHLLAFMVIIALIGVFVDGILFNRCLGNRVRARWGTA